MRILFASGMPYLPQVIGGLNMNTHQLALELKRRGFRPSVLARLSYGNAYGAKRVLRQIFGGPQIVSDLTHGYPVWRTRYPWGTLEGIERSEIAVIQDGSMLPMADACKRLSSAIVMYFHGLEFERWTIGDRSAQTSDLGHIDGFLANSEFTARRFRERYGLDATVVRPVFKPDRYRVERTGQSVTFINPIAEKGIEVALGIARACPDIPFEFVKAWPLSPGKFAALKIALAGLPNVKLVERTGDMREIYMRTRILLVPSQWEAETWGRVVSEAHVSGIPVLASDRGGLPESVGSGGVIVPSKAPIDQWVTALRQLWDDKAFYRDKSNAALDHSKSPNLNETTQIQTFTNFLERFSHSPKR